MRWPTDRRSKVRASAVVIVGGLAVIGVIQGVVWALVAPGQQVKVYPDGRWASLPTSDYHPFEALAIFVLAALAVGLVAAVATWQVRAIRGVGTVVVLIIGAAIGALVAYAVGLWMPGGTDPASVGASDTASIVTEPLALATPLVLIAEPLAAAVVYTFLAAWDGRPDLGSVRARDTTSHRILSRSQPGSADHDTSVPTSDPRP